ncbi:unnamed protein product, partial [Hermetia illucens]
CGKPATGDQDNDYPVQNDDDYQYDDDNSSPHSKAPVEVLKSTVPPVLVRTEYMKQVQPGEDAVLECPVKNLSHTNVVMWKNGTTVIAQSVKTTNNRVSVDNNYTLTIHKTNEWDSQTYTCIIYPQELKVNAKLTVGGNQQSEKQSGTSTTPSPSSGERVSSTYFTFLLSSVMTSLLCANSVRRI